MSGNVLLYFICVQLVKETTKLKKITKNNSEKWSNFCNIWNLQANLGKNFSTKYTEVYILVLILWKANRGVHSTTLDKKKIEENLPKMTKLPNFCNVWNIKAHFGKTFSLKYTKVYIIRETILLGFHCFLFHENILFASFAFYFM